MTTPDETSAQPPQHDATVEPKRSGITRRGLFRAASYLVPAALFGAAGYAIGTTTDNASASDTSANGDDRSAHVSGRTVDSSNRPVVAGIEIFTPQGRHSRIQTDFLGKFDVLLPLGQYEFHFSKGYEHQRLVKPVTVDDRRRTELGDLVVERVVDLASEGWYPGDIHQHSAYSDGYQDVASIVVANVAAGLRWGALTDHNTVEGLQEWQHGGSMFSGPEAYLPLPGQEVTTDRGHFNVIGATVAIDPSTESGTQSVERIIQEAADAGAIIQLNHPHLDAPMGFADMSLLPRFDLLEVWNGKGEPNTATNLSTKQTWYDELSAGRFIAATGTSDNHDITGGYLWAREGEDGDLWVNRGLYTGAPCTYVYVPEDLTAESITAALVAGRSFVTNGPLLRVTLGEHGPGDVVPTSAAADTLRIQADDVRGLERLEIVVDGEVVSTIDVTGKASVDAEEAIGISAGSWCLVEAFGADGGYAFTNPIRVTE